MSRSAIFYRVSVSKNCSTYISDICTIFVSGEKKLPNVLYLLPNSRSQKGQIVFFILSVFAPQVLSQSDLLKLLDRRDLTWSKEKGETQQELPGVFKVLPEEETTADLPSVVQ